MNKEQIYRKHLDNPDYKNYDEAVMAAMEEYRNQPPKSAGVKSPEDYLSEQGPYGEYVYSPDALAALTAQAQDHEIQLEEFAQFCEDKNGEYATAADLLYDFRNQKPRG